MKYELDKIIVALLGEVGAWGDTSIDKERLDNLEDYFELTKYLIVRLTTNIVYEDRNEASIKKLYERTVEMMETIREMVEVE